MSFKATGEYVQNKQIINENFENNIEKFDEKEICLSNDDGEKLCLDYNFFYMAKKLLSLNMPENISFADVKKQDIDNIIYNIQQSPFQTEPEPIDEIEYQIQEEIIEDTDENIIDPPN